jgi:hypothetical protein
MAPEIYRIGKGDYSQDPTQKIDGFSFRLILYDIIVR